MPGSAAEDYEAEAPGTPKFTTVSAHSFENLSEEIQIVTGSLNGLGSLEYEMVTVDPVAREEKEPFFETLLATGIKTP